jgi:DNA mismatch endonuclease, patch repair protein
MADIHSKSFRSYNMRCVKSKNTKPEILVRKFLFSKALRFRLHSKKLPGHPDIVLAKYKTAIFVNGCFWHGHKGCKRAKIPLTRSDWWRDKINKNKKNDKKAINLLKASGWNVIIIWTCELKEINLYNILESIKSNITN